jgi:hypothetical protein
MPCWLHVRLPVTASCRLLASSCGLGLHAEKNVKTVSDSALKACMLSHSMANDNNLSFFDTNAGLAGP